MRRNFFILLIIGRCRRMPSDFSGAGLTAWGGLGLIEQRENEKIINNHSGGTGMDSFSSRSMSIQPFLFGFLNIHHVVVFIQP